MINGGSHNPSAILRFPRCVAVVVTAVAVAAAAVPSEAQADTGPFTGAYLDSEQGEYLGSGQQYVFSSVAASGTGRFLQFTVSDADDTSFVITFGAPTGETELTPGAYENASTDLTSATQPGLDVSGNGRGCSADGRFVVDDAAYDLNDHIVSFSARFELHCVGAGPTPALFGFVSYNSMAPHRIRRLSAQRLQFVGSPSLPVSQTLTVTNDGPATDTPTGFTISGPDADDFSVVSNSCAGALDAGTSCVVTVRYVEEVINQTATATLTFTDELAPLGASTAGLGVGTGRHIELTGLPGKGSISGIVTNVVGTGVGGVCIYRVEGAHVQLYGPVAITASDGSYRISNLEPGTDKLYFEGGQGCSGGKPNSYGSVMYDGSVTVSGATPITVVGGQETSGIDVQMPLGGYISGRVTDETGHRLGGVQVHVTERGDVPDVSIHANTDANGDYITSALGAGSYIVGFTYWSPSGASVSLQWYDGSDLANASPVTVTAGHVDTGIDAQFSDTTTSGGSGGGSGEGGGGGEPTGGGGGAVAKGGTVSSAPAGTLPSTTNPVIASVTSPVSGTVTFTTNAGGPAPGGYNPLAFGMVVSAPAAAVDDPLVIGFDIDASVLPVGTAIGDVAVFRDGSAVADCVGGGGGATPDPCVASRTLFAGVLTITVRSSHASTWTFATATADRLFGADRYGTAAAVSQAEYPDEGAGAVVLARGDDYPDALVGAPLAKAKNAPLLLTTGETLPPVTKAELERVLPPDGTVYLLGGPGAIPDSVAAELASSHYQVVRYGGADRFATAVAVADALGDPSTVLLATGRNFPDALAAGPAASKAGGAVLLTDGSTLPPETAAYLAAHASTVYSIGGPAAKAYEPATPLVGADRYATAVAVARAFFTAPTRIGIATGTNFPDALAGGSLLAYEGEPLLTTSATLPPAVIDYLATVKTSVRTAQVFGGPIAVPEKVAATLTSALQ